MALLDKDNGKDRRHVTGPTPAYARMPRGGIVIIDADRLRTWRQVRGMTRADLALATRVSFYTIRAYERGVQNPHDKTFRRLCTALGIEPAELLFDDCRYIHPPSEGD